jgi:hypothetical protein
MKNVLKSKWILLILVFLMLPFLVNGSMDNKESKVEYLRLCIVAEATSENLGLSMVNINPIAETDEFKIIYPVIRVDDIIINQPSNTHINGDMYVSNIIIKSEDDFIPQIYDILGDGYDYYSNDYDFMSMEVPDFANDFLDIETAKVKNGNFILNSFSEYNNKNFGDVRLNAKDVIIDLNGNENMEIMFNNLESLNSNIRVYGEGLLTIYVNGMMNFKGDILSNDGARILFTVLDNEDYDSSESRVNIKTGSTDTEFYLYCPNYGVTIENNTSITTNIIAKNITLESGVVLNTFGENNGVYPSEITINKLVPGI